MNKSQGCLATFLMTLILLAALAGCSGATASTPQSAGGGNTVVPQTTVEQTGEAQSLTAAVTQEESAATAQPAAPEPTAPPPTLEADFFEGVWEQQGTGGVQGKYAVLFQDGKAWIGLIGDSEADIRAGASGLNSLAACPFTLQADRILITLPDQTTLEWKRSVDTIWIDATWAGGLPGDAAGEYLPGGE